MVMRGYFWTFIKYVFQTQIREKREKKGTEGKKKRGKEGKKKNNLCVCIADSMSFYIT